ncbi:MAG: hypothetical protein NTY47_03495 [Candidatus Omnitrophica bacterium]|nr:hypothetical protein [Candidatus Omnitrophota bacterium]
MTPDTFLTDGISKTYTTTRKFKANSTLIFLNGIYQGLGEDYTEDSGRQSITFKVLPDAGLKGEIRYIEEIVKSGAGGISSFKDQLSVDAVNAFLNDDEFAEEIDYTPKGGTVKMIKAIVNRQRVQPSGEDSGRTLSTQFEILIANDVTYGVASINKAGDTVVLAEREGGELVTFRVVDILSQDAGMFHLLIQK